MHTGQEFNTGQLLVLKKFEIAQWKKFLADDVGIWRWLTLEPISWTMFVFDSKNYVEDYLLDNIVYEENTDDENKNTPYEEHEEQDITYCYEDYNDEETTDLQDYDKD